MARKNRASKITKVTLMEKTLSYIKLVFKIRRKIGGFMLECGREGLFLDFHSISV